MSEPYDDLLSDADDVIEKLRSRIAELEAQGEYQSMQIAGMNQVILAQNAKLAELEREVEAQKVELFAYQSAAGNCIAELEAQVKKMETEISFCSMCNTDDLAENLQGGMTEVEYINLVTK